MRYFVLVISGLFLSGLAFSQKTNQPPAAAANDVTASKITVRGCIQGAKTGRFSFMQASTGASFELQGNTDNFKRSSGQLVEIQANELAPTTRRGLQSHPKLEVSKLRIIAKECPIQGYGKKPAASRAAGQYEQTSPATPRYQRPGASDQTPQTSIIGDPGFISHTLHTKTSVCVP
jgi:hypothetical protein